MTILNVTDANTGELIAIDTENPTGTISVVDQNTGEIVTIDLSSPTGTISVIDADTGNIVELDYANLAGIITLVDANTGEFFDVDFDNPSGTFYTVDENTGELVQIDLSTDVFFKSGNLVIPGLGETVAPTCVVTADAATITAAAFTATFTFSEDVIGFDATKITVTNGSAGAVAGTGPYTSVITPTATGTVTVQVEADKVTDAALNNNTASNTFSILYVNTVAWFDFSDIATLHQTNDTSTPVTADGQTIGYVADKSGSGNHATQATDTKRPLYKTSIQNGKSVARLDGTDDHLAFSVSAGAAKHWFLVARKRSAPNTSPAYLWQHDGAESQVGTDSDFSAAGAWYWAPQALDVVTDVGVANVQVTHLLELKFASAASLIIYANSTQTASIDPDNGYATNTTCTLGDRVAGSRAADYDIMEVLMFASALSDADRALVESYLNTKWALF
jgi:hypothetical protein